jgi:hypothetical protein
MSDSEHQSKKLKVMKGSRELSQMANLHQGGTIRMAVNFAEFLSDPISLSPRPEFVDNYHIDV